MIDYLENQTQYKAVHELPEHNIKDIQQQVMQWIRTNTGFLEDRTSKGFWMKVDYKDLGRNCRALFEYFKYV